MTAHTAVSADSPASSPLIFAQAGGGTGGGGTSGSGTGGTSGGGTGTQGDGTSSPQGTSQGSTGGTEVPAQCATITDASARAACMGRQSRGQRK